MLDIGVAPRRPTPPNLEIPKGVGPLDKLQRDSFVNFDPSYHCDRKDELFYLGLKFGWRFD